MMSTKILLRYLDSILLLFYLKFVSVIIVLFNGNKTRHPILSIIILMIINNYWMRFL